VLAATAGLPEHLAAEPWLRELYGQVDWSVRAVYGNELGWFDGDAEDLYPLAPDELARREVELMGGGVAVLAAAEASDDPRFAAHLRRKLLDAGALDESEVAAQRRALADDLRAQAARTGNTNGRGYLLQRAFELEHGDPERVRAEVSPELLAAIPLATFFDAMSTRLILDSAGDVHETLHLRFEGGEGPTDGQGAAPRWQDVYVTVRRGAVEITEGSPLPDTPAPVATLQTDPMTWKQLALQLTTPAAALATGALAIDGDPLAVKRFLDRFERGL